MDEFKRNLAILIPIWKEPKSLLEQNKRVFNNKGNVYWILHHKDKETIKLAKELKGNFKLIINKSSSPIKAVGLNIALNKIKEDILTVFDIDAIPSNDYFRGLKYLNKDIKVVLGKERVSNKNDSILTKAQDFLIKDWVYIEENMILNKTGGWIPIAGSGFFIKTKDMKEIGGWSEDTITEDADMTVKLLYSKKKMRFFNEEYFVKATTSKIVYINQRTRWVKGMFQLFKKFPNLKNDGKELYLAYRWLIVSPLMTLLKLFKYFLLFFTPIWLSFLFLIIFLIHDLDFSYWEYVKRHGLISRKVHLYTIYLEIISIPLPILGFIDYLRRPLYWYRTPK